MKIKNKLQKKIFCDSNENKLLQIIIKSLEKYHKESHSKKYWRCLIGPWLHKFVKVLYFRLAASEKEIKGITYNHKNRKCNILPLDTYDALWKFSHPFWNKKICKIIASKNSRLLIKKTLANDKSYNCMKNPYFARVKEFKLPKKILFYFFIKRKTVYILNSYLSKIHEILLNLKFYQIFIPNLRIMSVTSKKTDIKGRLSIVNQAKKIKNPFNKTAFQMLGICLPKCFLESYKQYVKLACMELFPKSPKIIFTSNNYEFDEVFKFWTANQCEQNKARYIIGQHGANYGSYRFTNPYPEERIPNSFITWGWKQKNKHIPGFIFPMPKAKVKVNLFAYKMVLILKDSPLCIETWDTFEEYKNYLKNQFLFVKNLSESVFSKTFLRFYPGHCFTEWNEKEHWKKNFPRLNTDTNKQLFNFFNPWKCIVFSYESTAFLESLACNIPTFGYFQGGLENIRKAVLPLYKKLIKNSILFETPEECAKFISKNWECLNYIWRSSHIQKAKNSFCNELCRPSARPVTDIYNILKKELNYENSWNK